MAAEQVPPCPHCPDGHESPRRTAWAVWVGPHQDGDGQPTTLHVTPTAGAHVAEADAAWLRKLIRDWARNVHGWGECAGCGWVQPLTGEGTVRPHPTEGGDCSGSGELPQREVDHG